MNAASREAVVAMLATARAEQRPIDSLPAHLVPDAASDAYAVQAMVAARLGWATLGWKVAATTSEMQARLRMGEPIFGRTFARFWQSAPASIAQPLLQPILEAEFLFTLARDLPPRDRPWNADEVADAVGAVHVGAEIAECRLPTSGDNAAPPLAIVADSSGSGHYVRGPAVGGWRATDLAAMPVEVAVHGSVRRRGHGRDVMGHPVAPLVWLANRLPVFGAQLRAGEVVSTGTASGMLPVRAGDVVSVRFGTQPPFTVAFPA